MSIQFNDSTNLKGLVQLFETEVGLNSGDISGDTTRLKQFTASVNVAWDDFLSIAFGPDGTWQLDDSNHTDLPFITTDLVSGQRDYSFTTDGNSNIVLDIFRVMVKTSSTGAYKEIYPVDQNTPSYLANEDTTSFIDGQNTSGIPTRYDKLANSIQLDFIPNYNSTSGLKLFINREPSYFVYTDTTKKPGVSGNLHKWFYLKPAYEYARRFSLPALPRLELEVAKFEENIKRSFKRRQRDVPSRLTALRESNK